MGGISNGRSGRWLATSTAMACVAIATPAMAQKRSFDVPAQTASRGISALAKQGGVQLLATAGDVRGKKTNAVRGSYSVDEALRILLRGTGLEASGGTSGGIITIRQVAAARQPASFTPDDDGEGDPIVITGSRIGRPGVESPVPLTSIRAEELPSSGSISLGDALDRLPALRSTFNQNNSGALSSGASRFGTAGINLLDLRGLGIVRTLVLVNGRRHVTSVPGDFLVDINTIPTELLERVDIVTAGNSATYGSDAVAGVVNFILKRNFEGIAGRVQGGITSRGDRGTYSAALTMGKNFSEGRGNVVLSLDYNKMDKLEASQRDYLTGYNRGFNRFTLVEPTAGEPAAGDGVIDNAFYGGLHVGNSSNGGTLTAICGTADRANRARCTAGGYSQYYVFQPNGTLALSTPSLDFRDLTAGSNVFAIGGLGYTELSSSHLTPGLERYSANLLAHYEVSDGFKPFVEAKFAHVQSNHLVNPSFWGGSLATAFGVAGNELRCNNPYLSAQAVATMQAAGRCADVANGTFEIERNNLDLGGRGELNKRDVYRLVVGAEGRFNDDWRYEISANYGQFNSSLKTLNSLIRPNFVKALNAVTNATGQIVCSVNADAISTNDDAACVPLNIFGNGAASAAAIDYVNTSAYRTQKATEFVVSGFIAGDLSQLFSLPGGPVDFVLGAEYRRETAFSEYDEVARSRILFGPGGPTFAPPSFAVKEVFGEVSFPLLKDVPFAYLLSVSASGRISDYKGKAGTVHAYNVGGTYAPIPDIRLRANYAQSVRAPTLSDLYTAPSQNFSIVRDPCDILYINTGASTRVANCLAAGVPAGFVNTLARASSIGTTSSGNANLRVETAKSLTIGGVLQPRFVPGLSISVDYYDIDVKNLISAVTGQQILDNCYDAADLDNQFCPLITRVAGGAFAPVGLQLSVVNFARQKTRGLDFEIGYARTLGNGHRVRLQALATRVLELNNFTNPASPTTPNRQLSELGDPAWAASLSASYEIGALKLGYELQYIGRQTIGTYEDQHVFNGRPPLNADAYADPWYPEVFYHNIRVGLDVNADFSIYGGVDNIADRKPPYLLTGSNSGQATYDIFGRRFYMGAKFKL
jgi:outer membrane receptor protein involved in Fe transport